MNPAPATSSKPSLWARAKAHILHPELSEQQVAWSFAIGFAVAWNPLLGLHTILVLLLCALFRGLHRPLMLLAAFINNPWTLVPMATASAYVGNVLRGKGFVLDMAGVHWKEIGLKSFVSWGGFQAMVGMLKPVLNSYLAGGTLLCLLALPVGYYFMLFTTRRLRQLNATLHHLHLPLKGVPHGHAISDAASPADAGENPGGPTKPAR